MGSTTTIYVTDADNREVLEYVGTSGAIGNWYAYGIGPDTVLSQTNGAGTDRQTLVPDAQGSIAATLDSASGSLTKIGYQPFGENPTSYSGTFRYMAQRIDPETGGSSAQPSGLSRLAGYVGATGALGLTRGERFASVPDQMDPVLAALAQRGLLYVDPRPGESEHDHGRLPSVWSRDVDVVIDEPDDAASIDAKLTALNRIAQQKGSALGLAGAVRPVTVQRIATWANELAANGLALAPVSALVEPPATPPSAAQAKQ